MLQNLMRIFTRESPDCRVLLPYGESQASDGVYKTMEHYCVPCLT